MLQNKPTIQRETVDYQIPHLYLDLFRLEFKAPFPARYGQWHTHSAVEFLVILEGNLGIETGRRCYELRAGDVFVMGSNQLHRTRKDGRINLKYIVFQLDPSPYFDQPTATYLKYFARDFLSLIDVNYIWSENENVRIQVYHLILFIQEEMAKQDKGYELGISAAIKRIFFLIIRNDDQGVLAISDSSAMERIAHALHYIEEHLEENISIAEISSRLNYNYSYFIKLFKKAMGVTFTEYVQYKRIKKAEYLLLTSDVSVTEISGIVGFSTPAQFYNLFKRFNGCAPKEFIKRMENQANDNGRSFDGQSMY